MAETVLVSDGDMPVELEDVKVDTSPKEPEKDVAAQNPESTKETADAPSQPSSQTEQGVEDIVETPEAKPTIDTKETTDIPAQAQNGPSPLSPSSPSSVASVEPKVKMVRDREFRAESNITPKRLVRRFATYVSRNRQKSDLKELRKYETKMEKRVAKRDQFIENEKQMGKKPMDQILREANGQYPDVVKYEAEKAARAAMQASYAGVQPKEMPTRNSRSQQDLGPASRDVDYQGFQTMSGGVRSQDPVLISALANSRKRIARRVQQYSSPDMDRIRGGLVSELNKNYAEYKRGGPDASEFGRKANANGTELAILNLMKQHYSAIPDMIDGFNLTASEGARVPKDHDFMGVFKETMQEFEAKGHKFNGSYEDGVVFGNMLREKMAQRKYEGLQMNDQMVNRFNELDGHNALGEKVKENAKAIEELKAKLAEGGQNKGELEAQLAAKQKELEENKVKLEEANAAKLASDARGAEIQSKFDSLVKDTAAMGEDLKNSKEELEQTKKEKQGLNDKIAGLEEELKKTKEEALSGNDAKGDLEKQKEELEKQKAELEKQKEEMQQKLDQLKEQNQQLSKDFENKMLSNDDLVNRLNEIEQLRGSQGKELEEKNKEIEALKAGRDSDSKAKADLEGKLGSVQKEKEQSVAELELKNKEIEELKAGHESGNKEKAMLEGKLGSVQKEKEQSVAELGLKNKELEEMQAKMAAMQETIDRQSQSSKRNAVDATEEKIQAHFDNMVKIANSKGGSIAQQHLEVIEYMRKGGKTMAEIATLDDSIKISGGQSMKSMSKNMAGQGYSQELNAISALSSKLKSFEEGVRKEGVSNFASRIEAVDAKMDKKLGTNRATGAVAKVATKVTAVATSSVAQAGPRSTPVQQKPANLRKNAGVGR